MKVQWIGHACFLLTTPQVRVLTDPYEAGYGGMVNYAPVEETADIVTISHGHADHNTIAAVKGKPEVVQSPGSHRVRGVEFTGIPSYHDKASGRERGGNIIFGFTLEGIRFCHLGDLGHPLSADTLRQIGQVDVLFTPTGGPAATLELSEVKELWDKLKPRLAIPMHFRNARCPFPKYALEDLLQLYPRAKQAGTSLVELVPGKLPTGVLILEPAR